MPHPTLVILAEDEAFRQTALSALSRRGFAVECVRDPDQTLGLLAARAPAVVLLDPGGPFDLSVCAHIVDRQPTVRVLVTSTDTSLPLALAAMRAGARDLIEKPIDFDHLAAVVRRLWGGLREDTTVPPTALAWAAAGTHHGVPTAPPAGAQAHADSARSPSDRSAVRAPGSVDAPPMDELLGASPVMRELLDKIELVAPTDTSVLITGESGTGKELVARALHRCSHRAAGPFVAVSCAAIPEALLENELFGHVRGAYTDARSGKTGLFARSAHGTLFLDEIGDMPMSLQPKLLRVLQERSVRPLGSSVETTLDTRLVTATNRDLEALVEEGRFRRDLFFRIHVIRFDLPPLRARGRDVILLAESFVRQAALRSGKLVATIGPEAAAQLLRYPWPGNVRELQSCIERAVTLARGTAIEVRDLPDRVVRSGSSGVVRVDRGAGPLVPLEQVEQQHVLRVLEAVGGNKAQAARVLGFDRKTLYRKLARYQACASSKDGD